MNKLEELLKKTEFTEEERKIYEKVKKNYDLQDLATELDFMLEEESISQEEYDMACNNAENIVNKFDDYMGDYSDWNIFLNNAIRVYIGG